MQALSATTETCSLRIEVEAVWAGEKTAWSVGPSVLIIPSFLQGSLVESFVSGVVINDRDSAV